MYPVTLDLDRERALAIGWSDGQRSEIALAALRRACPCASCRAERGAQPANPLRVLGKPQNLREQTTARSAALVGNYALRVVWNDGHDTGIYDFQLLRRLGAPGDAPAGSA